MSIIAAAEPFLGLLPEIWTLIREYLETEPYDGRWRVRLQRTCKEAWKMDKGLHLPKVWRRLWEQTRDDPAHLALQKCLDILALAKAFHQTALPYKSWFVQPEKIETFMEWNGPSFKVTWKVDKDSNVVASLQFYPRSSSSSWQLNIMAYGNKLQIYDASFDGIMMRAPMLCFGYPLEMVKSRAEDDDLEALFIRKDYRTRR